MFDPAALYSALDDRRVVRELTWDQVAREVSALAMTPVRRRNQRPAIGTAALMNLATRGDTSCQHALSMLHWLGCAPETFVVGAAAVTYAPLPHVGPGQQLSWHIHRAPDRDLPGLYDALDERRRRLGLSWPAVAPRLGYKPRQLTDLAATRFAIRMTLAMGITQWLGRPAADFIYAADSPSRALAHARR